MTFTTDIAAVAPECLFTPSYAAADYVPTRVRVATAREVISTDIRDFDAIDTKGRRFGARARICLERRDAKVDGHSLSTWLGQMYRLSVQAMRGGISYGGGYNETYHATLADAQAAAEKYFIAAEKRALKNKARAL